MNNSTMFVGLITLYRLVLVKNLAWDLAGHNLVQNITDHTENYAVSVRQ